MYDIITIGSATRDVFLTSPLFSAKGGSAPGGKVLKNQKRLCFALGLKIEIGKPVLATGGGATNSAVTFSRQGFKTAALVKIGQDSAGKDILNELQQEKISVLPLTPKPYTLYPNNGTACSTILLAPSGERTILVYRGASENLKIQEVPFKKLKSQWVYISPGKISFEVIEKIFNHFSKNKTLIAFNPSGYFIEMGIKKLKPLLAKSKVVILNREEATKLTGVDYHEEKEIFKKLDEIVPGIAIMTCGQEGVLVSDGKNIYQAGIFKEKSVIDRTGAGDAFASGFISGLIQKKEKCEKGLCHPYNVEYAIRLGSANATSVIEKIGAKEGILAKEEFENNKRWKNLTIKIL